MVEYFLKLVSVLKEHPESLNYKTERQVLDSTFIAVGVLQTEAGFMSLCYLSPIQTQQVIVGENFHTVVMSGLHRETKER